MAGSDLRVGKKAGNRRSWFEWHSWLGILSGLLMFIICWSGAFATLSQEMDWLVTPAMRVTPASAAANITAIHDVVAETMPDAIIGSIQLPADAHFAADVIVETESGTARHVYVDPFTLEVTGSTPYFNLQRFFRDFHMNFYGLLGWGKYAVCIFAIPLILSLVTALIFYKRWWTRFFQIRSGKGSKALWSSLHKTAGLWSLWFVLTIGITGTWYLFEAARNDGLDGKFSFVDSYPNAVRPLPQIDLTGTPILDFETLMARAQSAAPELDIRGVQLDRRGYFYVEGRTDALLVRDRANKMYLDPRDGRIVYRQAADDLSPYWRWSNMADPIHFGSFGGLATKLIWFAFGLILSGLSLTGGWLHLKRLQRNSPRIRWRGTTIAAMTGMLIFLFCVAAAFIHASQSGSDLPLGVAVVMVSWIAATLGIGVTWYIALTASHAGRSRPSDYDLCLLDPPRTKVAPNADSVTKP